ncbi:hypothetical protein RFI_12003 [Reticulomyxa filosa]|uniref:peptide-methionine (S)-S-oxide reductase n=1 Tax=Reticulomyxa filosa TaxID=46433 RepID=X6NGV2_RETFI|nr:hypothetical protein RFI_12003 [Reticulomyxa filosa]|eukprot:ETO25138.1 hypothetical protein RFI_12003 [Reticulomyxa filosa]
MGDHTEVVQVKFNPEVIAYEKLLDLFFEGHHYTFKDKKAQYKSGVWYQNEKQKSLIQAKIESLEKENKCRRLPPKILFQTAIVKKSKVLIKFKASLLDNGLSRLNIIDFCKHYVLYLVLHTSKKLFNPLCTTACVQETFVFTSFIYCLSRSKKIRANKQISLIFFPFFIFLLGSDINIYLLYFSKWDQTSQILKNQSKRCIQQCYIAEKQIFKNQQQKPVTQKIIKVAKKANKRPLPKNQRKKTDEINIFFYVPKEKKNKITNSTAKKNLKNKTI